MVGEESESKVVSPLRSYRRIEFYFVCTVKEGEDDRCTEAKIRGERGECTYKDQEEGLVCKCRREGALSRNGIKG